MPSDARRAVDDLLDHQHDLITPSQAEQATGHRTTLLRLVRSGELEPVRSRVYGRVGAETSWERDLLAAILSAGPPAMASHRAVARLLGLATYESAPLEITVPSKRTFAADGVVVHESRDLAHIPPISIGAIPCTPPRRLAVDIGAVLGETAYTTVIRDLRRDHGVTWRQLDAVLQLHSRRGRNGCGPLRRQLDRYHGIDGIPDTTLEQSFLDLLIDADYPLPRCQHVVVRPGGGRFRLDFAFVTARVACEVDGPHHRLPAVVARDRWRDEVLARLGWHVMRFTEEQLVYEPVGLLLELRECLESRGGWPGHTAAPRPAGPGIARAGQSLWRATHTA